MWFYILFCLFFLLLLLLLRLLLSSPGSVQKKNKLNLFIFLKTSYYHFVSIFIYKNLRDVYPKEKKIRQKKRDKCNQSWLYIILNKWFIFKKFNELIMIILNILGKFVCFFFFYLFHFCVVGCLNFKLNSTHTQKSHHQHQFIFILSDKPFIIIIIIIYKYDI